MITSDHSGFAGVQSPQIQPPPANIPSSELTVSFGGPTFETANTKRPGFLLAPHLCIYALT
ncbi:MAG: hypothetical protein WAQ45_05735, partial [Trichococcus flocculiformis]